MVAVLACGMTAKPLLLVTFAAILFSANVRGDNWPKLSGSDVRTADATSQANGIFIGEIPQMVEAASTVAATYGSVQVKVQQTLRGSFDKSTLLTFSVFMASKNEEEPKSKVRYIFFIRKPAQTLTGYVVFKILPATDANIAMVRKLIPN